MSTVPKSIRQLVEEARAERDAGMALAETGTQADWDRKLIDQAIDAFADSGAGSPATTSARSCLRSAPR